MKRPYKILLILVGAVALMVLVVVANVARSRSQVRDIDVSIRYGHRHPLVDEHTVADSVVRLLPGLLTSRVADVDRKAVAEAASHVPYLTDVTAAVSVSGKVMVHATQRKPVARLFYGNKEYLFDATGCLMPGGKADGYSLLVATGDFGEPLRADSLNAQMQALVKLATYLDSERRYRGMIDQIHVERSGNMIMVPKLGGHVVELGEVANLDTKFANLWTFYRRGMPRAGWDTYSRISLRFDGQVVCTKRTDKK